MKKILIFISVVILLGATTYNIINILNGNVKPNFITWTLWLITVSLSLATYKSLKNNLWDNIINAMDLIMVWSMAITTIFFNNDPNKFNIRLFDVFCLTLSVVILIFWIVTKLHEKSNLFLQIVMVLACLPTFYTLWNASESTESLLFWGFNWLAGLFGLIVAINSKNKLAIIYSSRSLILMTVMIILILRLM